MSTDRKYEPIKEMKGWYFVEYYPPTGNNKFATLNLVIIGDVEKISIVNTMEKEIEIWLNRYLIPLFVSAFDNTGELYDLSEIKSCNHLIGFFDQNGNMSLHWRLLKNDEIPNIALDQEYVDKIFSNLVYTTYTELDKTRRKKLSQIKIGWIIFFIWLVVIPLIIAFLDFFSDWVSLVALIYSFYKAIQKGLELIGKWPKSKKQKEQDREEQLKNHYYYHCHMNPEGFRRLMLENLENMAKEEIANEAEILNNQKVSD